METKEIIKVSAESGLLVGAIATILFPIAAVWQNSAAVAVVVFGTALFIVCGIVLDVLDEFYPTTLYFSRKVILFFEKAREKCLMAGFIGTAVLVASFVTHVFVSFFYDDDFVLWLVFASVVVMLTGFVYYYITLVMMRFCATHERAENKPAAKKQETAATTAVEDEYF